MNNGFFPATPFSQPLVFYRKARFFPASDRGKGTLDKQWLQILSRFGTSGRFLFSGALVICRGKPSPGTQMPVRSKNRHVSADLGKDKQRRQFRNAGNSGNTFDLGVILSAPEKKFCLNLTNCTL